MNKTCLKNKMITSIAMISIIISLSLVSYYFFLRTNQVDICAYALVQYNGESGNAKAKASLSQKNFNERIQIFMDSVEFKVTPNDNLKNGDIITIEASYDEEIANRYHIKPTNYKKTMAVSDLPQRLNNAKDISYSFLLEVNDKGQNYLTKYHDDIVKDFNALNHDNIEIKDIALLSRLFMNSKYNSYTDMIVDIYQMQAFDGTNEETIYYLVFYSEINDSFTIYDENVYGEKMFVKNDIQTEEVIDIFVDKYSKNYDCEVIY